MAGMKQNMRGSKAVLAAVRSRSRSSLSWIGHPVRRLISMMRQLLLPLRRAQTHLREPKLTHFSSDPGIAALNLFRVFGSRFPVRSVRACSMNFPCLTGAQDGIAVLRTTGRHEEAQDRLGPRFTEMKLAVRRRPCPVPANEATVP